MDNDVVLVVDDDAASLELLKTLLEAFVPARVVVAGDSGQAIRQARDAKPNVVLMDLGIPGGGLAAIRQLKSDPPTQAIPVIVLTGWATAREAAIEAGCDDFIAKPFELDSLLDTVRKHLLN